ncbi:MAG: CofH family radical SAM protein [Cyanobacteriota bacterium]|jgi:FO synthase subunit 2
MSDPTRSPHPERGLDPDSWHAAGRLLVDPPEPPNEESLPPLGRVLEEVLELSRGARADPANSFPLADLRRLGRCLIHRPWDQAQREKVREAADRWRRELVGDMVTYVVNRNLNATNHCVLRCGFCAFRRSPGEAGAFRLSRSELSDRAAEAQSLGATELCLQAGLDPEASQRGSHLDFAASLLADLREAAPGLHLHGFSPQELLFIAQQDNLPLQQVLGTLQQAGLGSVPGTAAEVLSPRVRRLICPEKLSAQAWVTVIRQVHQAGLPSTSTLMAGHVESPMDQLAHLCTLGALQCDAWRHGQVGFTEFILLPFVGAAAPPSLRARVGRDQPDPVAMLLLTAQARLLLGPWIRHHQSSWVKLTLPIAAEALEWGCDDLGGTLMEEHITTMAGAAGGTRQSVQALQGAARDKRRPVSQRTTLYGACAASR